MGSIPAAGGTTTSFSNTPQAKDDYYQYLEDVLREDSTLYNTSTNTLLLNVMSNDLGGNAKSLFSVEDGEWVGSAEVLSPQDPSARGRSGLAGLAATAPTELRIRLVDAQGRALLAGIAERPRIVARPFNPAADE